jgi:hypothetical protein
MATATQGTKTLGTSEPSAVDQTGLDLQFISDLTVKTIYFQSMSTGQAIADFLCLPYYNVVERALTQLKRDEMIEVGGSLGIGDMAYHTR